MNNGSTISVLGLVPYLLDTAPSQRFRLEQWRPLLEADGIRFDMVPFTDEFLGRVLHKPGLWLEKIRAIGSACFRRAFRCVTATAYDVVFVHRGISLVGPELPELLVRFMGRPLVFDFDDAIWLLEASAENRRWGWLKFPGKTAGICRLSTHVVVGNEYLAEYARQFNPNVTVVPTSIDTDRYRTRSTNNSDGPVLVGWTGSSTSQAYLDMFVPVLRELFCDGRAELRVVSDRKPEFSGFAYSWRPWMPETEVEEVAAFDIGIMPMPDNLWARGKCACKALQCMAAGVPTVCSDIGANREVIDHGVNGFLAATPVDWLSCLRRLIAEPELRTHLGAAGRRTVEERYSARHCATKLAQVLRAVVRK